MKLTNYQNSILARLKVEGARLVYNGHKYFIVVNDNGGNKAIKPESVSILIEHGYLTEEKPTGIFASNYQNQWAINRMRNYSKLLGELLIAW